MCPPIAASAPSVDRSFSPIVPACVPSDSVSQEAYRAVQLSLHPSILNHSLRVYIYAKLLSEQWSSPWHAPTRLPLLFIACAFHDLGTTDTHNGPQRFEVEGADAATRFLLEHKASEADAHEVWTAIALHTSPGIAERITTLARIVRYAVLTDFHRAEIEDKVGSSAVEAAEKALPRDGIEKLLGDAVVDQALRNRAKAPPASWAGVMLRSKLENMDWPGVNKAF